MILGEGATVPRGTRDDALSIVDALTVVLTPTTCPKESMVASMSLWASPITGLQLATYNCSTTWCWEWETPCVFGDGRWAMAEKMEFRGRAEGKQARAQPWPRAPDRP